MDPKTGIISFAHNENAGKNGLNPFCPSTKTSPERAKTIMVVRYKNKVSDILYKEKNRFRCISIISEVVKSV